MKFPSLEYRRSDLAVLVSLTLNFWILLCLLVTLLEHECRRARGGLSQ